MLKMYHVHPVDKPFSLKECHIHERNPTSLSVNCIMDGNMKKKIIFVLEVQHKKSWDLVANLTSGVPIFKCPICLQDCCDGLNRNYAGKYFLSVIKVAHISARKVNY